MFIVGHFVQLLLELPSPFSLAHNISFTPFSAAVDTLYATTDIENIKLWALDLSKIYESKSKRTINFSRVNYWSSSSWVWEKIK